MVKNASGPLSEVFALARKPVFLWYLLLALAGSALSGVIYQIAVA